MEYEPGKRIAFIIFGYGLGNSPSLINAAKMLANYGYHVDLFTFDTFIGNVQFDDSRIRIHIVSDLNKSTSSNGLLSKIKRTLYYKIMSLSRFLPWKIRIENEEKTILRSISFFVESIITIMSTAKYRCLIGVEPLGMMAAYQISLKMGVPFAYYNMELHIHSDCITPGDFIIKEVEKKLNKLASFTIAQDAERGRLITEENEIDESSVIAVPVCAEGEPFKHKTNCLRELFGLAADTRIILYAGFIADWAMCAEIAEAAKTWPQNWVLVFHTHGYNDASYIKKVRRYESDNLLFSLNPLPYDELSGFLASADIGIALYKDLGANFTLIGSASGKLAHYLKSGLPVIVNSYPGISKVVNQYNCGVAIEGPDQLCEAIDKIFDNYQQMHVGAYQCYEEEYKFSKYFIKVIDRIEQL